jgi:hypothetical protein
MARGQASGLGSTRGGGAMVPAPLCLVAQAASPNLVFGETYSAVKHEASGRTGGTCWPGVGVPRRPARSRAHMGIIAEVS